MSVATGNYETDNDEPLAKLMSLESIEKPLINDDKRTKYILLY